MEEEVVLGQEKKEKVKKKRRWYNIVSAVFAFILLAFVMAYAIFCFIFPSTKVVGVSMKPTLNSYTELLEGQPDEFYETSVYQDKIYVNRFDKGGLDDVVVVKKEDKNVVKRIIATPGQTLKLVKESDGFYYYYRDGVKLEETYIKSRAEMNYAYYGKFKATYGTDEITIQEGCLFVLGDNRGYSYDCAGYHYSQIKTSNIVGKVCIQLEYNENIFGYFWHGFWGLFGI